MTAAKTVRMGLPELPRYMRQLPVDDRGYPVPWFVSWFRPDGSVAPFGEGTPDFRVADAPRCLALAFNERRCWICGEPMESYFAFVLGPMCTVSRTTSEPACHLVCAEFAVQACPFMLLPTARRRDAGLPQHQPAGGMMIDRNPGVMAVWVTKDFEVFKAVAGNAGLLIRVGDPIAVRWWSGGRPATREAVEGAVASGLPALRAVQDQKPEGHAALDECIATARLFWPPPPLPGLDEVVSTFAGTGEDIVQRLWPARGQS